MLSMALTVATAFLLHLVFPVILQAHDVLALERIFGFARELVLAYVVGAVPLGDLDKMQARASNSYKGKRERLQEELKHALKQQNPVEQPGWL